VTRRSSLIRNIGPVSSQWLAGLGIYTLGDLKKAEAIPTYRILKERHPKKVSLNLLWSLEAAIREVDWRELSAADKASLKKALR
jgi:hypothetical protein